MINKLKALKTLGFEWVAKREDKKEAYCAYVKKPNKVYSNDLKKEMFVCQMGDRFPLISSEGDKIEGLTFENSPQRIDDMLNEKKESDKQPSLF